ncbi:MAG: sugar ABC transporter permease [Treponema sp.]|jgi:arabinogalactan oligomer/maltooligosaccharide transport system permease protein|nr:sugar ABC transporter permease [Treponema sp.]
MYKAVRIINKTILIVFLSVVTFFVLYPLVYVLSGAVSPGNSISDMALIPFSRGITFEHFRHLFLETNYGLWFRNTLLIAVATSALTVLVASLGAYVFSRFFFTFKKSMMMSLLVLQIFPSFVGMIAIYVILYRIGGLDRLWGLILVYLAGNIPYNTWLVKSYVDTVPVSLDEAARIDGANNLRIFFTIIMPVIKPILIFLAISSFTSPWMDFIFPKMVLRSSENQTLALGLFSFVTDRKNEFTNFAAGSVIVSVPFVAFFIVTQQMLVTAMGGAAVKE